MIFSVGINDDEIVPLTNFGRRTAMSVISARQGSTTRSISPTQGRWYRKSEKPLSGTLLKSATEKILRRQRRASMDYIRIIEDNIDGEHICCAMSGKQSLVKKEWLRQRFAEGLVFYRSRERGKCFIEYIPAEYAWVPIQAEGYLYINCLWVSGSLKGHGYSSELLSECIRDAKEQGKKGICILCAEGRKREFLADPKFLKYKGFKVADISDCGINLMYLPLAENADQPRFKDCARHPKVSETGFVLYYTDQCPFTYYWVPKVQEAAKEHGMSFQAFHITDKEAAQNVPAPVTTYALFRDGEFLTQGIQSDKKFLALAGIK